MKKIISVKRVLVHYRCCKCGAMSEKPLEEGTHSSVDICRVCNFHTLFYPGNLMKIIGVSIMAEQMSAKSQAAEFKIPACGNPNCCASTTIADQASFGSGELDNNGYWEHPCKTCAKAFKVIYPEKKVWPEA